MDGNGREEIRRMQDGVRRWVLRGVRAGEPRLGKLPPSAVLAFMCAAAFSPLVAAGAGVTEAASVAGVGVLSALGGWSLGGVITEALDRLREASGEQPASAEETEHAIARQIEEVLAAGDESAQVLRAEIAVVLQEISAGDTALRQAFETGNEQVRSDVVAAIGGLSVGVAGMQFLL